MGHVSMRVVHEGEKSGTQGGREWDTRGKRAEHKAEESGTLEGREPDRRGKSGSKGGDSENKEEDSRTRGGIQWNGTQGDKGKGSGT